MVKYLSPKLELIELCAEDVLNSGSDEHEPSKNDSVTVDDGSSLDITVKW